MWVCSNCGSGPHCEDMQGQNLGLIDFNMRKEQTGVDVSTSLAKHEIRCSKARYRRKKAAAFGAVVFSFHYIL